MSHFNTSSQNSNFEGIHLNLPIIIFNPIHFKTRIPVSNVFGTIQLLVLKAFETRIPVLNAFVESTTFLYVAYTGTDLSHRSTIK